MTTRAQYSKLEKIIDSLKQSTYLKVSLKGEEAEFEGLNSPYKSHCSIKINYGHGIPNMVVFNNHCNHLVVVPISHSLVNFEGSFTAVRLPSFHLQDLFHFPISPPSWVHDLVTCIYLERFSHFNEEGDLIEVPPHRRYLHYYLSTGDERYYPIVEKPASRSAVIGCTPLEYYPGLGYIVVGEDRIIRLGEVFEYYIPESREDEVKALLKKWGLYLDDNCPEECKNDTDLEACKRCEYYNQHIVRKYK